MSQPWMLLGACLGAIVFVGITTLVSLSAGAETVLITLTSSLFGGIAMIYSGE